MTVDIGDAIHETDSREFDVDEHGRIVAHHMTDRELLEEICIRLRSTSDTLETTFEKAQSHPLLSQFIG
jgi:hypothetical protein